MGSNTTDAEDSAATRLAHLDRYYREHPVTGPVEGHNPTVKPGSLLNLDTLDHVTASVREIADHTYSINPTAGPLPATASGVYDWAREHTEHADTSERLQLAIIEYRQYLEHAVRAGDHAVVCTHRCPKCRTFGLMWQPQAQRAACTNRRCVGRDGTTTRHTLARLAHAHIVARETIRQARAT